ncbi:MAG TPA: 2-C-methyl-D-erythritol 4-phosphate cytidylyltransferase [Mariniphaga anaerophila]|uniref:2-C-methyl-D-erythritol 4-phosphate cytidylyltransferase n=1 Tax=Mariniphaga anaerophila TaxID=1484053 RepID=A0A831PMT0_9BACT|nr:2-C-methyl-D-erythritol 4-phosphate cytidylyltransferase [Mariniphaga anaerophila]
MKKIALIVAGGSGSRMQASLPKQFLELNGKPILMHTFQAIIKADPNFEFFLVLPEKEISTWESLCKNYQFSIKHTVVKGGKTRFHSVKNGLEKISGEGIVFIHDGVRPLVSAKTIENCFQTALAHGNALPVILPSESVRRASGEKNEAVDRTQYYLVQTPQTFKLQLIKKAYEQKYSEAFTDDASVLENTGASIYLVEGNRENIKITWPADLTMAAALLG